MANPFILIRSFWLLVVLSAAIPSRSVAAEGGKPPQPETKQRSFLGKVIIDRPNTIYSDSSEVLREHRWFSALMGAGLLGIDVALGYYLDPMNLLEVQYLKQKDYFTGMMNLWNLSLVHFIDNSAYLRSGWGWRRGSGAKIITIIEEERAKDIYDSGFDLGIGNRWQWEGLSVGVEWIGSYIPLVNREEQEGISIQLRFAMVHLGLSI